MTFDKAGNLVVVLDVDGTVTAGPKAKFRGRNNPLILKYSPKGELIWSKLLPGFHPYHVSFDFSDSLITMAKYDGVSPRKYYFITPDGNLIPRPAPYDPVPKQANSRLFRQVDKEGNIYVFGAEKIKTEIHQPDDISYEATVRSIPMVAKYNPEGKLLWKFSCAKNCNGAIRGLDLDTAGNIWVQGQYRSCNAQPCFNLKATKTVEANYDFIAKISPAGELLLSKPGKLSKQEEAYIMTATPQGHILVHNGTSCLKYEYTTHPPLRAYDLNFNLLWENCLQDIPKARLDCQIIEQPHQTVVVGEKRTGMIQPGETREAFLDKQAIVFMRLNPKNGKTVWTKREKTTLSVYAFREGPAPYFYLLGLSGSDTRIGNKNFPLRSEFSLFVICYQ